MNKQDSIRARKWYIEQILGTAMKPLRGFDELKYAYERNTDAEYIRLTDAKGSSATLNITAMPLEEVLVNVSKILVLEAIDKHGRMEGPGGVITDRDDLIRIAPLFKKEDRYGL